MNCYNECKLYKIMRRYKINNPIFKLEKYKFLNKNEYDFKHKNNYVLYLSFYDLKYFKIFYRKFIFGISNIFFIIIIIICRFIGNIYPDIRAKLWTKMR